MYGCTLNIININYNFDQLLRQNGDGYEQEVCFPPWISGVYVPLLLPQNTLRQPEAVIVSQWTVAMNTRIIFRSVPENIDVTFFFAILPRA